MLLNQAFIHDCRILRASIISCLAVFHGCFVESLYTETKDNTNPFLIGSRLCLHSVTNGNEDYIFTKCKYYKLELTGEMGVRQGTNEIREGAETGILEWVDQRLQKNVRFV